MKLYISGPMTGIADYNYPAFNTLAKRLRLSGVTVFNPAENFHGKQDLKYATYIRKDIEQLLKADGIALLPNWERSKGARYEVLTGQLLDLEFINGQTLAAIDPVEVHTIMNRDLVALEEIKWMYDDLSR